MLYNSVIFVNRETATNIYYELFYCIYFIIVSTYWVTQYSINNAVDTIEITLQLESLIGMHNLMLDTFFHQDIIDSYNLQELRSLLIMLRFMRSGIFNCAGIQVQGNFSDNPEVNPVLNYIRSDRDIVTLFNVIRERIRYLENI